MTAPWIAPDGDNEPTIWTGDPDRPDVLVRRCDAPAAYDALARVIALADDFEAGCWMGAAREVRAALGRAKP